MRVLVAEDDPMMNRLLEALVTARGHEVQVSDDGAQALALYERDHPELVLLDWEMPVLDGLEACRRMRALDPDRSTHILVCTGRDREEDLLAVLDAGADDYVRKPVTRDDLHARLLIAERRLVVEGKRRDAEEALARAQWLAGIGETTITVQHEINNPLAALLGHAALLETDPDAPVALREQVNVIVQQAHRIADVVRRLAELEDPRSIEYVNGTRMIELPARKRRDRREG